MKLVSLLFAVFYSSVVYAQITPANNNFCTEQSNQQQDLYHQDELFVDIGGIKQWVAIRTRNCQGPLLLIVHGGPGNPTSHYTNSYFEELEKHFLIVHWDQRGAGRTFSRNIADTEFDNYLKKHQLTTQQMVQDGIELSEYLIKRFSRINKKKVILRGGSWGSYLALNMARQRPDLFHAYIGHSQLVNARAKHLFGYQESMKIAKKGKQEEIITLLEALGEPPYNHPRKYGQLYRIIRKLESKNATASTLASSLLEGYAAETEAKARYMGDDYSWMQYIGFERLGIEGMLQSVNLNQYPAEYMIPIYMIQGKLDITTPEYLAKEYFDSITAPKKEYFLVPDAAHESNDMVLNIERKILLEKILSSIN